MFDFTITKERCNVYDYMRAIDVVDFQVDGRFHRFGKKLEKSYIARKTIYKGEVYTFCRVTDFSEGTAVDLYQSDGDAKNYSKAIALFNKKTKRQAEQSKIEYYEDCQREAAQWFSTLPREGSSDYLIAKQVADIASIDSGLRFNNGTIYISMIDENQNLWSCQRIFNDGKKRYKGKKNGLIHIIRGDDVDRVYICEGYATGASIYLATKATVVVVFDAGNLMDGTHCAAKHFPASDLIIAADNDQWKKSDNSKDINTGLKEAKRVGLKLNLPVIYPTFPEELASQRPTDYNDIHCLYGLEAVREQINIGLGLFSQQADQVNYDYRIQHAHDGEEYTIKELAKKVMSRYNLISDYSGLVYQYNGKYWRPLPENVLRKYIGQEDTEEADTPARRKNVASEIVDYALLDNVDPAIHPNGVPWRQLPNDGNCVVFTNGVYNLNDGRLYPNRPEHYMDAIIPHRYDEHATCPTWKQCLRDWFGDENDERALALQQFFGYVIMPHARYKKALICFGPPNSGKSEIGKVLSRLVGDNGFCSLGFEQMDKSEALVQIKGKYLNLISEPDKQSLINDGNFKKLVSTGEAVTIRHLYRQAETYIPFAKHVILCNTLPRWNDETDATQKRLLLVEFDRVFETHEQDKHMEVKLAQEMEGIVQWALAGTMKVNLMGGSFMQPTRSIETLERHAIDQNPAASFMFDTYKQVDNGSISLRKAWQAYINDRKYSKMSRRKFQELLETADIKVEGTTNERRVIGFSDYL